ncbi:MAG: pseudaminic acid synthase [Proteobacteria bacterium]|nr:MAG: pseudaminic acid synthase [Pseudomonadota bacterium]
MSREVMLGGRMVGDNYRPYIIGEISGNHNGSLDQALEIVRKAAEAGVDALKLQTYTADTMTLDLRKGEFLITDRDSLWHGESLYDLYKKASTPWEWHRPIFELARKLGMDAFSTPFDDTAVDFLESLDQPFYKIASFENTDLPLIRKVAKTGKPVIISTGMATVAEIDEAVATARKAGCKNLILLKCTSNYPAPPEYSNLATIPHMREMFDCIIGLSDHTLGIGAAVASVALGARVIEKHITLSRDDGGVDSKFSSEPAELKMLVEETTRAFSAVGKIAYGPIGTESKSLQFRRSLYAVKDIEVGEALSAENVRAIRPGNGLSPKFFDLLTGRRARFAIPRGNPITWENI